MDLWCHLSHNENKACNNTPIVFSVVVCGGKVGGWDGGPTTLTLQTFKHKMRGWLRNLYFNMHTTVTYIDIHPQT